MEQWRNVKGYEGVYEVSSLGNVRRISYNDKGNKGKYLLPFYLKKYSDKDGYLKVVLSVKRDPKSMRCHRLVAMAFIDNPFMKKEINHKDGNKANNDINNLEWVTQSENRIHCLENLNPKLRNNKSSKPVYRYDLNYNFICDYPSAKEAMRKTGYSQGHISECCRGELKTYKKCLWSYEKLITCND